MKTHNPVSRLGCIASGKSCVSCLPSVLSYVHMTLNRLIGRTGNTQDPFTKKVIFSCLPFSPCALWADLPFQHPGTNGKLSPLESLHYAHSLCALLLWASSWPSSFPHLLPSNPLCPVHALLKLAGTESPEVHPDTPTAGSLAEPRS